MSDTSVTIPDQISTLELSKIWLYKAFQNLELELGGTVEPEAEADSMSDHSASDDEV